MDLKEIGGVVLHQKLGEGSFGLVRLGKLENEETEVAVKLEPTSVRRPLLEREGEILKSLQGCPNVPRLFSCGVSQNFTYLTMQLLGSSLSHRMRTCGGRLSPPTVIHCAVQMLEVLEYLHAETLSLKTSCWV